MNSFFIEFRDPLFSIITFFLIIFLISLLSYWYGKYKNSKDAKYLDAFLKQFRTLPSHDELQVLISGGELSEKSWLLLAHSYSKSGDYEKSIEIYNELLKIQGENQRETLFLLGKTYFKAGFLERSKQIFLTILRTHPRTPQALHYLLLVYEYMRDFKSALDVLDPLDALNKDIALDSIYLKTLALLNESDLTNQEKAEQLAREFAEHHQLAHMIFEYLFRVDIDLAWRTFDSSKSEYLSDILWNLDLKDLNLDIISQNGYLRELYSAKGYVDLAEGSSIFELDLLIKLKGKASATLSFEYICSNCKVVYPFVFNRCSSCHAIDTAEIEWSLTRDFYKDFSGENNSFQ